MDLNGLPSIGEFSLACFILLVFFWSFIAAKDFIEDYFSEKRLKENENAEREAKLVQDRNKELRERYFLNELKDKTLSMFSVSLDTIHESDTQDEIVRIVNLLAYKAAVSCVNEDKRARGEKISEYAPDDWDGFHVCQLWSEVAESLKKEWLEKRKLALEIAPKLESRMPHFTQMEPLKSYNAQHLKRSTK